MRNDLVKGYEKNDNLRLRIKGKNAKSGHNELAEKLKIKQCRVFPFSRELTIEENVDRDDTEEETKHESDIDIRIKESEEEVEGEKIEK